jgi:hypothetical protein
MALRLIIHPEVPQFIDAAAGNHLDKKADVLADLEDLKVEPEPGRQGWRASSSRVEFLRKLRMEVRRLTLHTNLPRYRFFYIHDTAHGVVYVMDMAKRNPKTYDKIEEPHIQRVIAKYRDYYRRQLWQR